MEETTKTEATTPSVKTAEAKGSSSIALGVAAVIILILGGLLLTASPERISQSDAEAVAQRLMDSTTTEEAAFVLDRVDLENGLFLVTFHVEAEGVDPVEQQMRLSPDGTLLLPDALEVDALIAQLEAAAAAQADAAPEASIEVESGEATVEVVE